VFAAARELLDERGVDGLTMRALAARLEVSPNALYSHVGGKTELIDGLLDELLGEVEPPDADREDPAAGLRALMTATYGTLLAHPELVPLYLARQGARGANAQHLGDVMLALLERAGVDGARAREAQRVLIVYTIGFAALAAPPLVESGRRIQLSPRMFANFSSGLGWLLAGITAAADGGRDPSYG
jgi:TetR/AcrR family tetracycline transcriptional repressor